MNNPTAAAAGRASRIPGLLAAATLGFALFTWGAYFWESWRAPLMAVLQLAVTVLIGTGCGRVLLRVLGFSDISESQRTLIGATMGLGLLAYGTLALAAFSALNGLSMAVLLAGMWLVGFTEMRAVVLSLTSNRNLLGERPMPAAFIFAVLLMVFATTWIPPHQYDSLVYHLPLAKAYVNMHGFARVEPLLYMHFPQNGEMLFTLALVLRSDALAQMYMWLSLVLSVWWIFEMGKREAPLSAVLLSCLLLVTHTSVMLLSATTYVEPLVMLWTTAAVLSFLRWRQFRFVDREQRSWLALSAIFTGLALGTKYYAGITAALFGAYLVWRVLRERETRSSAVADAALYVVLVTTLFLPWMIKNTLMAGNPLFPFFNYIFPAAERGWNAEYASGYFKSITEYRVGSGYFGEMAHLPIMLLTNSLRYGKGMDVLGGLGWELLFWSLPLAAWAAWRKKFLRSLLVFCACYLCAWFSTGVVLRFLCALAPLLCLLSGSGLYALWSAMGRWGRGALGAGLVILGVTHLALFWFVQAGVFEAAGVLVGLEDRDAYLGRRLEYYSCARAAESALLKDAKVLLVGEQRGYYIEQPHLATTVYGPNKFLTAANAAASPSEYAHSLLREGFSAMIVAPRELERLGVGVGSFTPQGLRNWNGLEPAWAKPLYRGRACTLYALTPESAR